MTEFQKVLTGWGKWKEVPLLPESDRALLRVVNPEREEKERQKTERASRAAERAYRRIAKERAEREAYWKAMEAKKKTEADACKTLILETLEKSNGLTAKELSAATGLPSKSSATWLRVLVRHGYVYSDKVSFPTVYYPKRKRITN